MNMVAQRNFQAQKKLLETGTFSDLTFHCDEAVWRVHRAVLAPRCAFFNTACSGEFAEAEPQVIEVPEDDPEAVDTMLQYLYTLVVPSFNTFEKARKAFEIADKYDLANFKVEAKKVLLAAFQNIRSSSARSDTPPPTCKPVERLNAYWTWTQRCPFDTTEFREALAAGCVGHIRHGMMQQELIEYASENPEFGALFMRELAERAMSAEDVLTDLDRRPFRRPRGRCRDA